LVSVKKSVKVRFQNPWIAQSRLQLWEKIKRKKEYMGWADKPRASKFV
jgi:hypothetical protein